MADTKIQVQWGAGESLITDDYDGPHVSFQIEPSGVLQVWQKPQMLWAAYAPGVWVKVVSP